MAGKTTEQSLSELDESNSVSEIVEPEVDATGLPDKLIAVE